MELWSGAFGDFQEDVANGSVFPAIETAFRKRYGTLPGESEQRAWRASLSAVADAVDLSRPEDVALSIEYQLPLSGQRIDAVFFGRSDDKTPHALIVELKQWSDAQLEGEFTENLLVGGAEACIRRSRHSITRRSCPITTAPLQTVTCSPDPAHCVTTCSRTDFGR